MPVIKKLSSLISTKRKTPTESTPTGYVGTPAITSAMLRDFAVQARHLEFVLSGGIGVTYSLPARIFGVTTTATSYQFVRFNGTSFVAAQANSAPSAATVGVLVDQDVVTQGVVNGFSGLVTGSLYYLSPSSAGSITDTVPTSGILVAVGRALSATSMLIDIDVNIGRVNKLETHVLPAGSMIDYGVVTPPSGWILCDGSEVSRSTYSDLFAAIGTSYGIGNGSTTFNLPDFRGRFTRYNDDMGATPAFRDTVSVTAGSFIVGRKYKITAVGTTNFTLVGAASNTVGVVFTATGVGSGTGTADESRRFTVQDQATAKNGLSNSSVGITVYGNKNQFNSDQIAHSHSINLWNSGSGTGHPLTTAYVDAVDDTTGSATATWNNTGTFTLSGTVGAQTITGDVETRPINLSCNKIIKLYNY